MKDSYGMVSPTSGVQETELTKGGGKAASLSLTLWRTAVVISGGVRVHVTLVVGMVWRDNTVVSPSFTSLEKTGEKERQAFGCLLQARTSDSAGHVRPAGQTPPTPALSPSGDWG